MNSSGKLESRLLLQLEKRKHENRLRKLEIADKSFIDFWSNDYLGLANNAELSAHIRLLLAGEEHFPIGATGSRLISGNYPLLEELEACMANMFQAGSATFFPSAYLANLALLGSLATRHDTYLLDEACHASLKEGVRLSLATKRTFRHNNLDDLAINLRKAKGHAFVITESLFSMDGDFAPIVAMQALCKAHDAILIVDEAHAMGIFGEQGAGLCSELGADSLNLIRVAGFGKAFGQAGGAILGPAEMKPWLANMALPFIYTTGPSPFHVFALLHTLRWFQAHWQVLQAEFQEVVAECNAAMQEAGLTTTNRSPIQRIPCQSATHALEMAARFRANGFAVKAILPPTVPAGKEMIRVVWKGNTGANDLFRNWNICEVGES